MPSMAKNKMKNIEKIIENLKWNKSLEEQPELLNIIKDFNDEDIKEVAKLIMDDEAVKVLKYFGYPRIKIITTELFDRLLDMPLPVVYDVTDLLLLFDIDFLIPYLKDYLKKVKNDSTSQFYLVSLARFWPKEKLIEIKPELIEIINECNYESDDAINLLFSNDLLSSNELITMVENKIEIIQILLNLTKYKKIPSISEVGEIFLKAGNKAIPYLKENFNIREENEIDKKYISEWQAKIIKNICSRYPKELISDLKKELINFSKDFEFIERSIEAIRLLAQNEIISGIELLTIIEENLNYHTKPENYSKSIIEALENIKKGIK
jgi:hypothetical protein